MSKAEKPEALAMLKEEHQQVKALLNKLKKTSDGDAQQRIGLIEEIRTALEAHMAIEQEIFYPAFRSALGSKDGDKLYFEALEEHHAASIVLQDALQADPESPAFGGKAKVLAELILHHAEEEEQLMFPKARKAMSLEQRRQLAEQMSALKHQLAAAA